MDIRVGDKVIIINPLQVYSEYDTWAKLYRLKNWKAYTGPKKDSIVTVLAVGLHTNGRDLLFGIEIEKNISVIIDKKGIKLYKKASERQLEFTF